MSRARYIGSKARIAARICDLIGPVRHGPFVDLFSGTGVVSREAASRGWKVHANDHLVSSSIATRAQLLAAADVPFQSFGGYAAVLKELNEAPLVEGFVFREYTPSGMSASGHVRKYFTPENGRMIDGIRAQVERWFTGGVITESERVLLIADLLGAANRVANIAGTYGCFLGEISAPARKPLHLVARRLLSHPIEHQVTSLDVFDVDCAGAGFVYLDPPYTKRQYAAYYHLLETIAMGDSPAVAGVTGLRPWEHKSSPFCFRRRALPGLLSLIAKLDCHKFAVSYSDEGQIPIPDLVSELGKIGHLRVFELGEIGRYRPNSAAHANGSAVTEYLLVVERDRPPEKTYEVVGQLYFYECPETV